jgi:hypothetical protein
MEPAKAVLVTNGLHVMSTDSTSLNTKTMTGIPIVKVNVLNGSATVVWEWVHEKSSLGTGSLSYYPFVETIEEVSFGVVLVAKPEEVRYGIASVGGSFCPTTHPPNYSASGIIPRFLNTSTSMKAFEIVAQRPRFKRLQ